MTSVVWRNLQLDVWWRPLLAGLIYFLLYLLSHANSVESIGIAAFWPASGFALAVMIRAKRSRWWTYLVGFTLGVLAAAMVTGVTATKAIGYVVADVTQPLLGALIVTGLVYGVVTMANLRQVVALGLAAVVGAAWGAVIGAVTVVTAAADASSGGGATAAFGFASIWWLWFIEDLLGMLAVAPVMLAWWPGQDEGESWRPISWRRVLEATLCVSGLTLSVLLVFGRPATDATVMHYDPYWTLPFLLWAALRLGRRGTTFCTLLLTVLSIGLTQVGRGPFALPGGAVADQIRSLQFFLCVHILAPLVVASLLAQRRQARDKRAVLEQRLRQAQKMEAVGQLAGGIAHDFNNLLSAVVGYAELARMDLTSDHEAASSVDEILTAADRGKALTGKLLAFSRKQVLHLAPHDLNEVVHESLRLLGRVIGENIQVETRLATDLPAVEADPIQMEQVLINLAINARDAMPGGGKLIIETGCVAQQPSPMQPEASGAVQLRVQDTGEGMAPEVVERAFEPFFTTKAQGKGTGLGLATVHGIVTQHRGEVRIVSAPGQGTSVAVVLPVCSTDSVPTPQESPPPPTSTGGTETILLVEDEIQVLSTARSLLEGLGYRVIPVQDSAAAPQAAGRAARIDLLLTDVVMPGVSGPELWERLMPGYPELKVLFMSGFAATSDELLRPGIDYPLLEKPFTRHALACKVREVLDQQVARRVV